MKKKYYYFIFSFTVHNFVNVRELRQKNRKPIIIYANMCTFYSTNSFSRREPGVSNHHEWSRREFAQIAYLVLPEVRDRKALCALAPRARHRRAYN